MYKCDFCNKEFKTTSSLNHHKKTTKYCLQIQNKNNTELNCEYCSNNFTSKQSLQYHLNICKDKERSILKKTVDENIKLKDENIKLKDENIELKLLVSKLEAEVNIYKKDHETVSNIAKQTKVINNTNNNIINNLSVYDIDKITEKFADKMQYITKEDIINGQKAIANIIAPCLVNDDGSKMLTCTDSSRLIFTKIDKNKNKIKDIELKNLATAIKPIAIKKADEIVTKYNKNKQRAYEIEILKIQIKDYNEYIKKFSKIIEDAEIGNINVNRIPEYKNKIYEYEEKIKENEEKILENEEFYEEDDDDRLIDGHEEIKHLDSESSKFARHVSKLI